MGPVGSAPPVSPDVMVQQMPPMAAYADQGRGMIGGGGAGESADPMKFVQSLLDEIAERLMKIAQVVGQSKKELMPIVQKMAEAGSMLMNEIQPKGQEQQTAQVPPQAEGPGGMGLGA